MLSMVASGAHTPLENVLRPTFSWTPQWSPAALTRRVSPASPGGRRTQPSGAGRIVPSAARTVFGVGPGVKVVVVVLALKSDLRNESPARWWVGVFPVIHRPSLRRT